MHYVYDCECKKLYVNNYALLACKVSNCSPYSHRPAEFDIFLGAGQVGEYENP